MHTVTPSCTQPFTPPATRRAVGFENFGSPQILQLLELPNPLPQPGEVRVRVRAASVNPTDVMMLEGAQAALMRELSPPYVAGMELAGHIEQLGEGVQGLHVGQPVMGIVNPRRAEGGAHAQWVCLPAVSVVPLAPEVDMSLAATVPMNGLTARICLELLNLPAGATLLVTGAAGTVGSLVLQFARHAGLRVLADAKDEDRALLRQLGAHELLPRGETFAPAVRALCPAGVDGLVDAALLGDAAAALVREGGAMVSLRRSQQIQDTRVRHAYVSVLAQAGNTAALAWLASRLQDGSLKPRLAHHLPMAQAAQAYELVRRGGLRGRVVLDMTGAA